MRRNWSGLAGAVALLFAACGGAADSDAEQGTETAPPPPAADTQGGAAMDMPLPEGVTQAMVAQGKTIFEGVGICATCHGVDGTGTTLAPNLTDAEWLNISGRNYDEIVGVVTNGVPQPKQFPSPMMPKAGTQMTDDQVRAVAAYVYTLSH